MRGVEFMKKRLTILVALVLCSLAGVLPGSMGTSLAQDRHVLLEEFTGSWCGYCVRGAYAIELMKEKYPDRTIAISIHNNDMMRNNQGDSLQLGVPGGNLAYLASAVTSFPQSWTARHAWQTQNGPTWRADPALWIDTLPGFLMYSNDGIHLQDYQGTPGLAEQLISQNSPQATVTMDNLTFDPATRMVSVRMNTHFIAGMSGDLRMTIAITEDSVSGTGANWDQTNYYYQCTRLGDASNPFWSQGDAGVPCDGFISNWQYMDVYRGSPAGIWGAPGIIPFSVDPGSDFTQTFTFPLPLDVANPNNVHIIGFVNQYSQTDPNGNEIFDAAKIDLAPTPVPVIADSIQTQLNDGQYIYAHAKGDTTTTIIVQNFGSTDIAVNLAQDKVSAPLPVGWSMKFSSPSIVIPSGSAVTDTIIFTAPEQADYTLAAFTMLPTAPGAFVTAPPTQFIGLLSDDTRYGEYLSASAEAAAFRYNGGMVDSMSIHTALIPLSTSTISAYTPQSMDMAMFVNNPILDNPGTFNNVSVIQAITDMLEAGKKIYISSPTALFYALDPQALRVTGVQTSTQAVTDFFLDTLGIKFGLTQPHTNTLGQYVSYSITGTTDPIGAGMLLNANVNGVLQVETLTSTFTIPSTSKAVSLFNMGTQNTNIGCRYQSTSGARLVYLGFSLNDANNQVDADTIFHRSMEWLLGSKSSPASVPQDAAASSEGMTAMPNPFHGTTEVRYTAASDEHNVTFSAFDLLGHEVSKLPVENVSGTTYAATFNANDLANGTYVIVVHSSTGSHNLRVVNQH